MTAELRKKREELEKKLTYAENAHASFYKGIGSEGAYRESAAKIHAIYDELAEVARQLGDPIPHQMR